MEGLTAHLGIFPSQSPPALTWKAKTHIAALTQRDSEVDIGS